jgi:hypothetical protein
VNLTIGITRAENGYLILVTSQEGQVAYVGDEDLIKKVASTSILGFLNQFEQEDVSNQTTPSEPKNDRATRRRAKN